MTSTNARKCAPTLDLWRAHTNQVFEWVHAGALKVFAARYPLAQAADAHRALQERATMGKQLLIPEADVGGRRRIDHAMGSVPPPGIGTTGSTGSA